MFWSRTARNSLRRNRSLASRGKSFRFGVERLEDRLAPANVTATVQMGVLFLTAQDGAFDDTINISSGSLPGHLDITGTGTTINGKTTFTTNGTVNSIVCRMKGGADQVSFGAQIAGNLTMNLGDGSNFGEVTAQSLVGGSVRFSGSNTDDAKLNQFRIIAPGVQIGHDVIVTCSGKGICDTRLGYGAAIGGKVSITGGGEADAVTTQALKLQGSFVANLGGGDNFIYMDADDATPNQEINAFTTIGGAIHITTGLGADTINIGSEERILVLGKVSLITGDGADTVNIDDARFYSGLFIDLGAGNDHVFLDTTDTSYDTSLDVGGLITVLGRAGNDFVAVGQASGTRTVYTARSPKLDGGGGTDSLLLVDLRIEGTQVDMVSDLNPLPVGFENIAF